MELEDFCALVRDAKLKGFVDSRAERELTIMLYYDNLQNRANAFEYLDNLLGEDASIAFEVRKSWVLPFERSLE